MVIERNNENLIITVNASLIGDSGMREVERFADYLRVLESNAQNKGTQEDVDELSREVNKKWWEENKHRLLK